MALVFGEEKKAKPKPSRIKLATMNSRDVFLFRNVKRNNPMAVTDIPNEASILGSILSESLPAKGEKTACTMGWEIRINPALCGLSPFIYCKYRLKRNVTANVAQ